MPLPDSLSSDKRHQTQGSGLVSPKQPMCCGGIWGPLVCVAVLLVGVVMLSVGFSASDDCFVCYATSDSPSAGTEAECNALHGTSCEGRCEKSSDPYECNGGSFRVLVALAAVLVSAGGLGLGLTLPLVHGRSLCARICFFVNEESARQDGMLRDNSGANQYLVYGNL